MTKRLSLFTFALLMNILFITAAGSPFYDLRCENLVNPISIDNATPHFSWKIVGKDITKQQCYESVHSTLVKCLTP